MPHPIRFIRTIYHEVLTALRELTAALKAHTESAETTLDHLRAIRASLDYLRAAECEERARLGQRTNLL